MPKMPKHLRRNPEAPHVKVWHAYRKRKGRPKAQIELQKGKPLTINEYLQLIDAHYEGACADLQKKKSEARTKYTNIHKLMRHETNPQTLKKLQEHLRKLKPVMYATVSVANIGYRIAKEIIADFKRTGGLRAFGFGVGYSQLLFFLEKYMGVKARGVELEKYSKDFTRNQGLRISYGKSADDVSLRKFGKFDLTDSILVLDVIDRKTALGMLDNAAKMTRKGGKSYHVITVDEELPISREDIEKRGFRIDKWERLAASKFIKLTKVRD